MRAMIAVTVFALVASPVASAGMFDWLLGRAIERAVEEPAKDAIEKGVEAAVVDALINRGGRTASVNNKKQKTAVTPVASRVEKGDHLRLPLTGNLRFPVPEENRKDLSTLQAGQHGGYMDRFGSEWIPYRANGRIVAWRSDLSDRGRLRLGKLAGEQGFVLVGVDGKQIDVDKNPG